MTEIMRPETAADFLAAIPVLVGYRPRNSVVCVAFRGSRTGEAFRLDLPPARRSNQRAVTSTVIGMLSRMAGVTGAAVVVYTDESFDEEHGIPQLDIGRMLTGRVHGSGFHLHEALCVASDGWAGYFERDYPREGHPLSDIDESDFAERLTRFDVLDDIGDIASLPERDPAVAHRLEELLDGFEQSTAEAESELARLDQMMATDPVSWSCALSMNPDAPTEVGAWFLYLAQHPSHRDLMIITIAFGCEFGERAADCTDGEAVAVLGGRGSRRPDVSRVEAIIPELKHLIANAPDRYLPGPLCMLSWFHWSLGMGSAAGSFIDRALDIDPEHSMARVLHDLYATGMVPDWAYSGSQHDHP
jgi:hypothetical protein